MTSENFNIKIELPEDTSLSKRDKIFRSMTPVQIWNIKKVKDYLNENVSTEFVRNGLIKKAMNLPDAFLPKFMRELDVHVHQIFKEQQEKESFNIPIAAPPDYNKNKENQISDLKKFLEEKS
jgi:hypothetical protein